MNGRMCSRIGLTPFPAPSPRSEREVAHKPRTFALFTALRTGYSGWIATSTCSATNIRGMACTPYELVLHAQSTSHCRCHSTICSSYHSGKARGVAQPLLRPLSPGKGAVGAAPLPALFRRSGETSCRCVEDRGTRAAWETAYITVLQHTWLMSLAPRPTPTWPRRRAIHLTDTRTKALAFGRAHWPDPFRPRHPPPATLRSRPLILVRDENAGSLARGGAVGRAS